MNNIKLREAAVRHLTRPSARQKLTNQDFVKTALAFYVTAPLNNMRTLKFKAQPTNAFSAIVNQMLGGSSQLPTIAEHCFVD